MLTRVLSGCVLACLCCNASTLMAQWDVRSFGKGELTKPFEVKVADARNDGGERIYVSERDGNVTEWTYSEIGWSSTIVAHGVKGLALLAIGDVRGDGRNRIYFSEFHEEGAVYEVEWRDGAWQQTLIAKPCQSLCLFIGPGRGDGKNRLYVGNGGNAAGSSSGLWEYTHVDGTWAARQITSSTGMQGAGVVGDLHHDGVSRVLAHATVLDELAWDGTRYVSSPIDHGERLWPAPTGAGDIRNDGRLRVFINGGQGKLEYSFGANGWIKQTIDTTVRRGDLVVARLHADGKHRLYATHSAKNWGDRLPKGPLKEFSWEPASSAYQEEIVVDAITGATAKLAAGDARNDNVTRLYAPDYEGGRILEITSDNPYVEAE